MIDTHIYQLNYQKLLNKAKNQQLYIFISKQNKNINGKNIVQSQWKRWQPGKAEAGSLISYC